MTIISSTWISDLKHWHSQQEALSGNPSKSGGFFYGHYP